MHFSVYGSRNPFCFQTCLVYWYVKQLFCNWTFSTRPVMVSTTSALRPLCRLVCCFHSHRSTTKHSLVLFTTANHCFFSRAFSYSFHCDWKGMLSPTAHFSSTFFTPLWNKAFWFFSIWWSTSTLWTFHTPLCNRRFSISSSLWRSFIHSVFLIFMLRYKNGSF